MICRSCKKKLSNIDIYCLSCGVPTEGYKEHFSIKKTIALAFESNKIQKNNYVFYTIPVIMAILTFVYLIEFNFLSDDYWVNYVLMNSFMVVFVPLMFLPFLGVRGKSTTPSHLKESLESTPPSIIVFFRKYYLKLVALVFFIVLYFFILKVICQGDPILNLVRLVLVCWGLAIAFPVPYLIFSHDWSVFKSIWKGYLAGKYLRWHQFLLCLILGLIFVLLISIVFVLFSGVLLIILLLLLMMPIPYFVGFTSHLMRIWYLKQNEFELFDKNRDY